MRILRALLGYVSLAAMAAFAAPAGAVQWWSSPDSSANNVDPNQPSSGPWAAGPCTSGGAAASASGCQQFNITTNVNGTNYTMKVRAYSTPTVTNSSTNPGGDWKTAQLFNYSGNGFGITNRVTGDTNEGNSPEHAVDNDQVYDLIVFEMPQVQSQTWDLDALQLGWARENNAGQSADIQAWFGGGSLGANYDFTKVCFTGCTSGAKTLTGTGTTGLGFTDISSALTSAGNSTGCAASSGGTDVCQNGLVTDHTTKTGNYVVMAGRLGDVLDAFKPEMIQASLVGGPGGKTPLPGTIYLLGLGLAGLVVKKRRPAR